MGFFSNLFNKNQDPELKDFEYEIENENTVILTKVKKNVENVVIPGKTSKYNKVKIRVLKGFIPKNAKTVKIEPGVEVDLFFEKFLYKNKYVEEIEGLENLDVSNVERFFYSFTDNKALKKINVHWPNIKAKDMCGFISGNKSLKEIDITGLDTSNVEIMGYMFNGNKELEIIKGLETLDTSNAKNMDSLFFDNDKIKNLDVSNFNTENVENMEAIFLSCENLEYLDLGNWNTKNVKSMKQLFCGCDNLKEIKGVENLDVSNVENMEMIFEGCKLLKELNLSNWNTKNVKTVWSMFSKTDSLEKVDLTNWNTSNLEDAGSWFSSAKNLKEIKGIEDLDVSNVKSFNQAFWWLCSLDSLDISKWDLRSLEDIKKFEYSKTKLIINENDQKQRLIKEYNISQNK